MSNQVKLPYTLDNWIYHLDKNEVMGTKRSLLTSIDLELSKRCNLFCRYCYANAGKALDNELNIDEIILLIDRGKKLGLKSVTIVGGGEPLLVVYLNELIDFLFDRELQCAVVTNGTFLDEKRAKFLFSKRVAICIKVNSLDNSEIFDNMVGVKGTFEKVHNAIKMLLNLGYASKNGPNLAIESIACRENMEEIPKIWRWARDNNILPIIEFATPQGRAKESIDFLVSKEEAKRLFDQLSYIDRNEYSFYWESLPSIAGAPCRRLYYSCYITSIGEVYPCAGINISIGDIRKVPLDEILSKSQLLEHLRKPHIYLKGKCSRCEVKENCYGCRGKAFWLTGDPLEEDPICWR